MKKSVLQLDLVVDLTTDENDVAYSTKSTTLMWPHNHSDIILHSIIFKWVSKDLTFHI